MSREVRRVPLDWKHPVEHNPYWLEQSLTPFGRSRPLSWLHSQSDRFVPLYGEQFTPAYQHWERERVEWEAGQHEHLQWLMRYHSAEGYEDRDGQREQHPYKAYAEDGNTVVREFFPASVEEILAVYPYSEYATEPTVEDYFPDWDVPEDELGWVLYETVSEGTPVSPVFKTADELIEHLCIIGQDWDQVPMRRAAAEALVRGGHSAGSFMIVGNTLYDGSKDLDLIEALPKRDAPENGRA